MNPQFPIYIPSKGRYRDSLTMRHLETMRVPYCVIVEAQEYDQYAAALGGTDKLLVLDTAYRDRYETLDAAGDAKGVSKGSGPARNFAWDHAVANGAAWHWIIDDNISGWLRLYHNKKIALGDGTALRCMEDFVLRYKNVGLAGPQYETFIHRKAKLPPFVLNTRIYSCILIRNDLPFRWRGRYNEDTDLSLRVLKARWCTIEFYAFMQVKSHTQSKKGGNTDAFYASEGTLPKSQMIVRAHPDVARVIRRFGRWHHYVDYGRFKNNPKLLRRGDIDIPNGVDEYGMTLTPTPYNARTPVNQRESAE